MFEMRNDLRAILFAASNVADSQNVGFAVSELHHFAIDFLRLRFAEGEKLFFGEPRLARRKLPPCRRFRR